MDRLHGVVEAVGWIHKLVLKRRDVSFDAAFSS